MIMKQGFTFGNELIRLDEVDSTNTFLQELGITRNLLEGLVVVAKKQTKGRGQRGNSWETDADKNLTFSLLLKPNLVVSEQFLLSKAMALGIYDFLTTLKIKNVQVKWPNDVMVNGQKIAGILIENTLKQHKIATAIVGIGLNVSSEVNGTSLMNELGSDFDVDETLHHLLIYLEKRYMQLRALNYNEINTDYLNHLLGYQIALNYQIEDQVKKGTIMGISPEGKLRLEIGGVVEEFGMKELRLIL